MPTLVRITLATLETEPESGPAIERWPVDRLPPRYPAEALEARRSDKVKLAAAVTPDGDVLWPVVVHASGYAELGLAARDTLRQWHYPKQPPGPNERYLFDKTFTFGLVDNPPSQP